MTFNTPFGRYRNARLPFGVHSASEVFQQKAAQILDGQNGVINYQDDILIWASSKEEHEQRLTDVMRCIENSGMKLNMEKCVFMAEEIKFLGHVISADGIRPDPEKVKAINEMPVPQNREELQRFLGMTNYLCKFISSYSEITSPLRKLMETDIL